MALTTAQQRLILNATLNLDPASQRKIENAFGEGLVKKLLEASTDGGEEFAAGAERIFDKVHAAQARLNAELRESADYMREAAEYEEEATRQAAKAAEANRKAKEAAAAGNLLEKQVAEDEERNATAAKEAAELNMKASERAAKNSAISNREGIKKARAELSMNLRAAKNFESMYDAAAQIRKQQLDREEEIYKFAGERKATGTAANITQDLKSAMQGFQGVVESPTLENVLAGLQDATVGALKRIEAATKDSSNKIVKSLGTMATKLRGTMEGWSEMVPGGLFDIIKSLVKVFIKLYDASRIMAKGFTDSVPALEYQGERAGFTQTKQIAEALEIPYTEAAQLVGEAWAENVSDGARIQQAVITAKSLGLSVSEVLSQSKKLVSNFGRMANIFGETAGLAEATGMSLQSAYGILQSVTTGVQLMNTDLKKSFGYVKKLVMTFGEELGQQLAQSLGIVRGMSPQDALKELLLMKEEDRRRMFELAMADTSEDTPQGRAAKAMLERATAAGATLEDQAIALRHIGPRAELYMEGKRGGGLFGDYKPTTMGFAEAAGRASLGMTSADTEVRQFALSLKGMGDGVTAFNNSVGMAAGNIQEMAKSVRTFDESVNRYVDKAAVLVGLGGTMNYQEIGDTIADSIANVASGGTPESSIPVKDFVYRGDGKFGSITPINSQDQFFGAMPGGPIDTAMKMAGVVKGIGGLGGAGTTIRTPAGAGAARGVGGRAAAPSHVTVNINGGDLGKVYEVVRNVLRQSGLRPPAGAYAG